MSRSEAKWINSRNELAIKNFLWRVLIKVKSKYPNFLLVGGDYLTKVHSCTFVTFRRIGRKLAGEGVQTR